MSAAVSNPSIVGIRTSIRINANVWRRTARNPARPELTTTMSRSSGASIASIATRWLSRSLITRTDGRAVAPRQGAMLSFALPSARPPQIQRPLHRAQELGQSSGGSRRPFSTGLEMYPVAPASRQRSRSAAPVLAVRATIARSAARAAADRPDRGVAVHDRHHDVHQHEVDVGCLARARRSLPCRFRPRGPRHRPVPAGR